MSRLPARVRPSPRRARLFSLLAVLALLVPLAACSHGTRRPDHDPTPPVDAGGRALFGAYVAPESYTDAGRLSALENFEDRLGRRLGLVMSYHPFTDELPGDFDRAVAARRGTRLVLSWNGTDTRAITSGRYDDLIRQRAEALKALDRRVLLRWKWEMNRPNTQAEVHGPADYIAAWRHLRAIFAEVGTPKVAWVWCPAANNWSTTRGWRYYPGDDQVDWLCADAYTPTPSTSLASVLSPYLRWARSHDKRILIGEFGTRRGASGARARWLGDAMSYLRSNAQIHGVMYYESANAPVGAYDLGSEPDAFEVLRTWAASRWLSRRPPHAHRR